jgi:hypothetical protein
MLGTIRKTDLLSHQKVAGLFVIRITSATVRTRPSIENLPINRKRPRPVPPGVWMSPQRRRALHVNYGFPKLTQFLRDNGEMTAETKFNGDDFGNTADRRFAATAAHRFHRPLPDALAAPGDAACGYRTHDRPGQNSSDRRQQFFAGPDADVQHDTQLDAGQPSCNLFERTIEADVPPYAVGAGPAILSYGAFCRGLLSERMTFETKFGGGSPQSRSEVPG